MAMTHLLIHLAACGESTRAIGIVVQHAIRDAIDHALWNLCSSRTIEIYGRHAVDDSSKRRELRANGIELMCDVGHRQDVIVAFQAVE